MSVCKITYHVIDKDRASKDYGLMIARSKKFESFNEAARFARTLIAVQTDMVGKPLIVIDDQS